MVSIIYHHELFMENFVYSIRKHLNVKQPLIGLTTLHSQSEFMLLSNVQKKIRLRKFLRMLCEYSPKCFYLNSGWKTPNNPKSIRMKILHLYVLYGYYPIDLNISIERYENFLFFFLSCLSFNIK